MASKTNLKLPNLNLTNHYTIAFATYLLLK